MKENQKHIGADPDVYRGFVLLIVLINSIPIKMKTWPQKVFKQTP